MSSIADAFAEMQKRQNARWTETLQAVNALPPVEWRQLQTPPRVPFTDPVAESLYQAAWEDGGALNAHDDAERIVEIVRAAIAQNEG